MPYGEYSLRNWAEPRKLGHYRSYCRQFNLTPVSENLFFRHLPELIHVLERQATIDGRKGVRCWLGIEFLKENGHEKQDKQDIPFSKEVFRQVKSVYGKEKGNPAYGALLDFDTSFSQNSEQKVRFLVKVPVWIGKDGKTYGPAELGQEATFPLGEAEWLVQSKLVEICPKNGAGTDKNHPSQPQDSCSGMKCAAEQGKDSEGLPSPANIDEVDEK